MKSIYKLLPAVLCSIVLFSCEPKEEFTVFKAIAETEFGEKMIRTELVGHVHEDLSNLVVSGVRESYMDFLSMNGYITKVYCYEIDLEVSDVDISISTSNNYNSTPYSRQRLTGQAELVDRDGFRILGGINGDNFNATGTPSGILYRSGTQIKAPATSANTRSYFAITKDKKAIIGNEMDLRVDGVLQVAHLRDAIGGRDWLVKGGEIMPQVVPIEEAKSAVGITGDSKIILFVVDGGLFFYSNGMVLADVAKAMKALGAESAIALSSGRNSTVISRRDDNIILRNVPSNNNVEEPISNGIVVVQK